MTSYEEFVARKRAIVPPAGFEPSPFVAPLFPFQRDLVTWAVRRGRAALFCGTGLGKTAMQLEWSRQVAAHGGGLVLILAPLAVSTQTIREGAKFGIDVRRAERDADITGPGVWITNYERLDSFDAEAFDGIVLDESSIIKHHDGKTRTAIIERFARTPYRLACTATPAPNDHMELGNHAEFLGIMTRAEMLAMYFCHDGGETQKWRLRGHAEDTFWRWCCSWAAMVRAPSDLGYDDGAFKLPPLSVDHHVVASSEEDARRMGFLFAQEARTLDARRSARRATTDARVAKAAELANNGEQWIVWCDLNAEGDALTEAIDGAVQVAGADTPEHKERAMLDFADGKIRVLVTKPRIAGFGMNWQGCARMAFVGVTDSWEAYFQAVRRCWRFGQTRPVEVHVITSDAEGAVVANLERKEADATRMADEMSAHTIAFVREAVKGAARDATAYEPSMDMAVPTWIGEELAS